MGSALKNLVNNYDEYVSLCEKLNEKALKLEEDFYTHEKKLLKKHNWSKTYFGHIKNK